MPVLALVSVVLAAFVVGCCYNLYEPAWCATWAETGDTVRVVTTTSGDTLGYEIEVQCLEWVALSDSTKRFDQNGKKIP
jgi:hypothetical protein